MCSWFGGPWFGGGMFMMLMMLVFWAAVIAGGIALFRWIVRSSRTQAEPPNTALEILKQRYAKGEISREEFERMKLDIN